jgi:hypothetical protein
MRRREPPPPPLARRPLDSMPPAWTLTAALGALYVLLAPVSSDLAAAGYRSELFARAGFTIWDDGWFAGHHLLAYSVLAPALGALLGVQLRGARSMTLAAALFGVLVDGRFAPRASRAATVAKLWFALGSAVALLANRIPFELGLCIALGALAAAQAAARADARHRRVAVAAALALAALSALASPIAGAFLALAALAWAVANGSPRSRGTLGSHSLDQRSAPPGTRRALPLALAAAALAPVFVLELAFPESGTQPFVASAFYPALAAVLALAAALPPREHVLRTGALLYAGALTVAYTVPTAVGGNADRLGALLAGPLLACALVGRHPAARPTRASHRRTWALLVLAPLLLYWQLKTPLSDFAAAAGAAAEQRSYYTPLLAELRRLGVGYGGRPARIEVVPTEQHAESRWVAAHVSLARGWERQLDVERNGLFYYDSGADADPGVGVSRVGASAYRAWLGENAVSYVALSDAPPDYAADAEARLVREAPGYLRQIWRSAHWRLYAIASATSLAQPPAVLTRLGEDSFELRAPRAGSYVVRVHFTPYWGLADAHGCVSRAPGDWTAVRTRNAGVARVAIEFSLARVFEHGPRCR